MSVIKAHYIICYLKQNRSTEGCLKLKRPVDMTSSGLNIQQTTCIKRAHFKERGGGQTFSTSFWMRFSQAPLCRCRFKNIFDDIIFLLSGNIIEYICF